MGVFSTPARSALSPELQKALESSKYIYVASTRKNGELSKAAEIWFMLHNGAVWVTRTGVHVDRIATAWAIRKFVDADATFAKCRSVAMGSTAAWLS